MWYDSLGLLFIGYAKSMIYANSPAMAEKLETNYKHITIETKPLILEKIV